MLTRKNLTFLSLIILLMGEIFVPSVGFAEGISSNKNSISTEQASTETTNDSLTTTTANELEKDRANVSTSEQHTTTPSTTEEIPPISNEPSIKEIELRTKYFLYHPETGKIETDTGTTITGSKKIGPTASNKGEVVGLELENGEPLVQWEGNDLKENSFSSLLSKENDQFEISLTDELASTLGKALKEKELSSATSLKVDLFDQVGDAKIRSNSIPLYIQAPKVKVPTDDDSLQKMLTDQTITGSGEVGNMVTIVDGQNKWIGTVDSNGQFQIATKGLKLGDTVTIVQTNGIKGHSVSDPVKITFQASKSSISLLQPQYIVFDPITKVFYDNQNKEVYLEGTWENLDGNSRMYGLAFTNENSQHGLLSNYLWNTYIWAWSYNVKSFPDMYENNMIINSYKVKFIDLLDSSWNVDNIYNLSTKQPIYLGVFNANLGVWDNRNDRPIPDEVPNYAFVSNTIPFYIKAPKVNVSTDESNLQKMLVNQTITGSGQVGDTVTIVDGQNTWTGTVGSDGQFQVATKGMKFGDSVTITETNGTGEHSKSDSVTVIFPSGFIEGNTPKGTRYNPTLTGKDFGLLFTPQSFDFGVVKPMWGEKIHQTLTQPQYVGIGDERSTISGWQLTAEATTLKNQNGDTLGGTISMHTAVKHVSYTNDTYQVDATIPEESRGQSPQVSGMTSLKLGEGAETVMNPKQGTGEGLWAVELNELTLDTQIEETSNPGTYTGSVTWDLINAP